MTASTATFDILDVAQLQTQGSQRLDECIITVPLGTITALAGAVVVAFIAPKAGTIQEVRAAVNAAFTVTDIVITPKIGGSSITSGAITLATSGSAALTKGSSTPSAANTVAVGDVVNMTITGGVGAVSGVVQFVLRYS